MKKSLLLSAISLLSGCSYYHQFVDKMNTDSLVYQCQQQSINVERRAQSHQVSLVFDNQHLKLDQGLSAIGQRYTDGVYVLWMKTPQTAELYRRDTVVLADCQRMGED